MNANFPNIISPAILLPVFFAELSFSLWLIVKGVDPALWEKKQQILWHDNKAIQDSLTSIWNGQSLATTNEATL